MMDREYVGIRQATQKGYIECEIGGVADFSYPTSKLRRGRVQGGGHVCRGGGQDGMQHSDNIAERSTEMAKVGQISNEGSQCGSVYSDNGNSPTLTAGTHGDANSKVCTEYRIRKLTPKECWRLMDFSDADFHKAEKVNSNTQLYKQAGNSIVVNVLVAILGQLFIGKEDVYRDCKVKK
jgi:DNA (cytosine-5)-methyltransferase 1